MSISATFCEKYRTRHRKKISQSRQFSWLLVVSLVSLIAVPFALSRSVNIITCRGTAMLPSIRTVPVSEHLKQKLNFWGALFSSW